MKSSSLIFILAFLLCGCSSALKNGYVVTQTDTLLGFDLSDNPQTQLYRLRFGYLRQELALVPTNKNGTNTTAIGNGARDAANVIMEVRYGSIFASMGGIYQRLAIGDDAVSQPGAALMFAKDAKGNLALTNIPTANLNMLFGIRPK